ncbi:MAG: filamentous hemagglutinin N-terminal domain-containing protein [Verrucomicrobiales bacterium]|nr:filamentous hemagglutinin N-terminal domain-containing protein [Verrucomicrobiales bacterium]
MSANPAGATIVNGGIDIQGLGTSMVNINQSTQSAIINWQDFSINAGETTHFNQVAGGIVLNRVIGGNPSAIYGTLSATGTVMVVNPQGILVGPSGVIDVKGALTLSTLDIDNNDFLNGGANRFFGDSTYGVTNYGNVRATNGAMFLGGFAHNFNTIESTRGAVALASGSEILVDQSGDSMITVRGASDYTGIGVNQQGTVTGASIDLQSHGNAYALAINNGGISRATGGYKRNGRSVLKAMGSSSRMVNTGSIIAENTDSSGGGGGEIRMEADVIENSGTLNAGRNGTVDVIGQSLTFSDESKIIGNEGSVNLNASGMASISGDIDVSSVDSRGGDVVITGEEVMVNAIVNASGASGGSARIGGDIQGTDANGIQASSSSVIGSDALFDVSATSGDGGQIVVWSDGNTFFEGEARANATGTIGNGGFIEVSGKNQLTFRGLVSAYATSGNSGLVLFDPGDLVVGNDITADIQNDSINNTLQGGTSVLLTTYDGDITFLDTGDGNDRDGAIQWTNSNASFGAFAGGQISVQTHIRTSGAGSINLIAGWDVPESAEADVTAMLADNISVADIFDTYVTAGQFGASGGNVLVGNTSMTRYVTVGSRFGDTNVAGNDVILAAGATNGTEMTLAQIGFHDSGQIFAPRMGTLDLNSRALEEDNNPLVGIVGVNERSDGMGVYAMNAEGVHDGGGPLSSGTNETFIPYANDYMDERNGNWWWQQIDLRSRTLGDSEYIASYAAVNETLGALRPESGAGLATDTADINVLATGNVFLLGGGAHLSSAQIGHGGSSAATYEHKARRSTGNQSGVDTNGGNTTASTQTLQYWSQNGATSDRSAMAIARLAPVYGNINVLAGVNVDAGVNFNHDGNVTAILNAGVGDILVQGLQAAGGRSSNPEANNASQGTPSMIGHGGIGQFGTFDGDIQARAGRNVSVIAGSGTRAYAQIGHNIDTYHYWDPPSGDHQIRFFANASDFNDPLLRRGELFTGFTNIAQALSAGTTSLGETILGDTFVPFGTSTNGTADPRNDTAGNLNNRNELSDPIAPGPNAVAVEALDGSVVSGFHGDVVVEAVSGNVTVEGYSTPNTSETGSGNSGDAGLATSRDRRYARIGHGGTSSAVGDEHSGYRINGTNRYRELVQVYFATDDDKYETAAATITGQSGNARGRGLTFMTITGDIDVRAGSDISVLAGNDLFDFAQIGHGGNTLADYETSSVMAGNIDLRAGRNLTITGGGEEEWTGNRNNQHTRAQAHVGHGGYRTGFLHQVGDISVNTIGNVTITGGAYGDSYAKIGHLGSDDFGSVGGDFTRAENFNFDGVSINIDSKIEGNQLTVTYSNGPDNVGSPFTTAYTPFGVDKLEGATTINRTITSNTANIYVDAGGLVTLDHLASARRLTATQIAANRNIADTEVTDGRRQDAYAQIGHGGSLTDQEYHRVASFNYDDMVGDITVDAFGVLLESGDILGAWSRIGHGVTGDNMRVRHGEEMLIGGFINVFTEDDVFLNGAAGAEKNTYDDEADIDVPAKANGVVIGHGAILNRRGGDIGQMAVLDTGGVINGVTLSSSTITVDSGGDVKLYGGNGGQDQNGAAPGGSGTHAQIGHGAPSLTGQNVSSIGYNGDINVIAVGDIELQAGNNDLIEGIATWASSGGAAVIGNGGIYMDAPASGDINVQAGNDLKITATKRIDVADNGDLAVNLYTHLNFAKIGHFSAETSNSNSVDVGTFEGDISVVVGNDLVMTGGQTTEHDSSGFADLGLIDDEFEGDNFHDLYGRRGVTASFAQIGHGGPGIRGRMDGNIEVLVANNMATFDGTIDNNLNDSEYSSGFGAAFNPNNYVKIGHGDWIRDGTNTDPDYGGVRRAASGVMEGNIVVAVGNEADLEHTLIGHADPTVSGAFSTSGTTDIAVSRNAPFYSETGTGSLITEGIIVQSDVDPTDTLKGTRLVSGTVFTSGGFGDQALSIYIPQRSLNEMSDTTRLNADTSGDFYHANFGLTDFPTGTGTFAGEDDEVFLAPDLWWMSDEDVAEAIAKKYTTTGQFPTAAGGGQGGIVAEVDGEGGLPNLTALTSGALGSSPNGALSRAGHSLSGGAYTVFYDAITPVSDTFAFAPAGPGPDLAPSVFNEGTFDVFERQDDGFDAFFGNLSGLPTENLPYREQDSDELGVPGQIMEEFLDMIFGPRRTGGSQVNNSGGALQSSDPDSDSSRSPGVVAQEDNEELERQQNRNNRPSGIGGTEAYIHTPGSTSYYSSFEIFGEIE